MIALAEEIQQSGPMGKIKKVPKDEMVRVRFPRGLKERAVNAAAADFRDLSSFVVALVARGVEEMEAKEAQRQANKLLVEGIKSSEPEQKPPEKRKPSKPSNG